MTESCPPLLKFGSALLVALAAQDYQLAAADDTAEWYIGRHIQAVGGRERLQGIKSQVLTFEAQEGNQSFDLEFSFKSGNKVLFRASLPNGFRITQGYSSEGPPWRKGPEGVREFNRPQDLLEFRELLLCLDVTALMELKDNIQRLKLLATEKVNEVDCQVIEAQFDQDLSLRLYFALNSGLLTKVGHSQLADYQPEEGVKIPHLIRKPGGSVLKLKKINFNVPLADSLFVRPAGQVATVDASGRPAMMTNMNHGVQLGIARRPSAAIFEKEPLSVLPRYKPESTDPFQVDLRSADVSKVNVTDRLTDLLHANFDTKTRWPTDLPADFVPNRILETGKNPGLKVRELHARGITGKGIGLAIIDQALLVDHIEYKERLKTYEEIHLPAGSLAQMHGPAVASIAVGKTVGVAPEADLYYVAEMHGSAEQGKFEWDFTWLAQSTDRILELNRALPKDQKIRVISISVGWSPNQKGCTETDTAVQRAKAEGVFVISTALEGTHHLQFHGLGRESSRNPDQPDSYGLGSWWAQMFTSGQYRFGPGERLLVPMDARATASPTGENDYVFYANGGWSWCVPYIAGLYALACQVNPEITPENFWAAALKTGHSIPVDCGGKKVDLGTIVDPVALIHSLQPGS
jgi:hypothetical protein